MEFELSKRVESVKPSSTLMVAAKARALKLEGLPIIDLGVGEPDFDTPDHIKIAAITAINRGFTKYTPVEGIINLRKAICHKFKTDNGLDYTPEQIIVTNGGKQAFYNLAQALLNRGDEVIIPAPYWVSYPDMVLLASGKPVFIKSGIEQQFKITAEQLEAAITPKTRLVVLNSPSNPSGMAYTKEELKSLGKVLVRHPHILIATDDMYEYILWGKEPFCNILMACPELYERTIILHGVSKTYAMTGWRIGFAAGPLPIIKAMFCIQSQSTSGACSISQVAAETALKDSQACVHHMVAAFKERHDYFVTALNELPGVECAFGDGTFYAFPKVEGLIKMLPSVHNDIELADFILREAYVATVPGSGFGTPGYLRCSFSTSLENLQEFIRRLNKLFKTL